MNNQPQDNGPLKHVERPTAPRRRRAENKNRHKRASSAQTGAKNKGMIKFWTTIIVIAIVAVAMVPIIHSQLSKQNKNLAEKEIRSSQSSHSKKDTNRSSSFSKQSTKKSDVNKKSATSNQSRVTVGQQQYTQSTQTSTDYNNSQTNAQTNSNGTSENTTSSVKNRKAVNGSYTVQAGDSLSEIAAENNTTVEKLRELNGLSGDTLASGQNLKVK